MKLTRPILILSLLANAALAVVLVNHRSSPAATGSSTSTTVVASTPTAEEKATLERAAAAERLTEAVKRGDPAGVRDQLRALGLPENVIRSAVRAVLFQPVVELSRELSSKHNKDGQAYWRGLPGTFSPQSLTREERAKLRDAHRDANQQLEALLGPDPEDAGNSRYAFLPGEKAAKLRQLDADYRELRSQVAGDTDGFRMPADEEKFAYLEQERRKDMEALLSAEELAEYDRRTSATANRLRYQLRSFDVTEDEYKAIYAAQKAYDDRFSRDRSAPGGDRAEEAQQRLEAQRQLQANLRSTLGEQRYAEYQKSQDPDYSALQAAARRFDLPAPTVENVYNTREQTVAAAQRIANDSTLNPEQRSRALASLAEQTRTQIRTTLGNEVGEAYLRSSMRWLEGLQRGQPVTVNPDGTVSTARRGQGGNNPAAGPFTQTPSVMPFRPTPNQ